MAFTSFTYLYFLAIVVALYWLVRNRTAQNVLLVIASYVFYGWLTPWYCALLAVSTVITYGCLHLLWKTPEGQIKSRWPVVIAIGTNIGMLAILKYWNFWLDDIVAVATNAGWKTSKGTLNIALPLGLSFYTLQAVGLVVDAYRGDAQRESPLNIALFLAFFPKLISGPFEKASLFLGQVQVTRHFALLHVTEGMKLLLSGLVKKMVIAENIGFFVGQIQSLNNTSIIVLIVATIGFACELLADFSGYTDLARGSARLLGFSLKENFNYPYLAISPSDFWQRWHISLSQWFRDYVYIPIRNLKYKSTIVLFFAVQITMLSSGIWHGATSGFALWGLYYGVLIFTYDLLGYGGHWKPQTRIGTLFAWSIMTIWTLLGWFIFKSPSIAWIGQTISQMTWQLTEGDLTIAGIWLAIIAMYSSPWLLLNSMPKIKSSLTRCAIHGILVAMLLLFSQEEPGNFFYFQF